MESTMVDLMTATMGKIRDMVNVNTIIGEVVETPDGTSVIPVSKVSFGFGTGGTDFPTKEKSGFGGGGGAGVSITPIAFLVIQNNDVRLIHVSPKASSTVDRVIDMVPKLWDKVEGLINKNKV